MYAIRVRDVAGEADLADCVENATGEAVWTADSRGFLYVEQDENHRPWRVMLHRLGTAQNDDVIGLTWPLATYIKEAGLPYLFHGHNGCGYSMRPAQNEPVFYWQSPDGDDAHKVLARSTPYGGYAGDGLGDASEEHISNAIQTLGVTTGWPYDALLLQDGTDFQLVTIDNAVKIHNWNAKYNYPRLICSTMDMFFNDLAAQAKPGSILGLPGTISNQPYSLSATAAAGACGQLVRGKSPTIRIRRLREPAAGVTPSM